MPQTSRGYWYPARTNMPRFGWQDIQRLAQAVNDDVEALDAALAAVLTPASDRINTSQTTASTTYTNLATVGPTVTIVTGTQAIVILTARMRNTGVNLTRMAVDISGASSIASDSGDERSVEHEGTGWQRASTIYLQTGLTAGSNVFKAEYRVVAGTGTFEDREVTVIPLL